MKIIFILLFILVTSCRTRTSELQNIITTDPVNPPKSQGTIGSCASFGAMSFYELEAFQKWGVTLDLSEAYIVRYNLLKNARITGPTTHLVNIMSRIGVLPESELPYSKLINNPHFIDATDLVKQGFLNEGDPITKSWELTQSQLSPMTPLDRVEFLNQPEFLGPIKAASVPSFTIPLRVPFHNGNQIPHFAGVPCFIPENQMSDRSTPISARDFAKVCLEAQKNNYNRCLSPNLNSGNKKFLLKSLEGILDNKRPFVGGFKITNRRHALFTEFQLASDLENPDRESYHHALVGVGYLNREEFLNTSSHEEGFLKGWLFEKYSLLADYPLKKVLNILNEELKIIRATKAQNEKDVKAARTQLDEKKEMMKLKKSHYQEMKNRYNANRTPANYQRYKESITAFNQSVEEYNQAVRHFNRVIKQGYPKDKLSEYNARVDAFNLAQKNANKHSIYPFNVRYNPNEQRLEVTLVNYPTWILNTLPLPQTETLEQKIGRRSRLLLGRIINEEDGFFIVRNSWGEDRGVEGYYLMSYKFFLKKFDSVLIAKVNGVDMSSFCR